MAYIRVKWIKGNPYLYEQASYRVGSQVKTKHIRYIGKFPFMVSSGGSVGFPLPETLSPGRKEQVDEQISKLSFANKYPYEREILRQCLYHHIVPLKVGGRNPKLINRIGYILLRREDRKVIEFALRKTSRPFTWMHELGHLLDSADQILDENIKLVQTQFIDTIAQAYHKAIKGGLREKANFIQQFAPLIDLRQDFEQAPKISKSKPLVERKIYQDLQDTKAGLLPKMLFNLRFKDWVKDYYRLQPDEVFADTVATLILDHKKAFEVHTTVGKKYVSKVYIKLLKHLEDKYHISLGRPKGGKQQR